VRKRRCVEVENEAAVAAAAVVVDRAPRTLVVVVVVRFNNDRAGRRTKDLGPCEGRRGVDNDDVALRSVVESRFMLAGSGRRRVKKRRQSGTEDSGSGIAIMFQVGYITLIRQFKQVNNLFNGGF
jgi:hypothetical protein